MQQFREVQPSTVPPSTALGCDSWQNPLPWIQPGDFCFADVHEDPPGAGAAGDQGLKALFHREKPQWLVGGLLSVSAIGESCWINPPRPVKLLQVPVVHQSGRLALLCFYCLHLTVSADYSKRYGQDLVM